MAKSRSAGNKTLEQQLNGHHKKGRENTLKIMGGGIKNVMNKWIYWMPKQMGMEEKQMEIRKQWQVL